MWGAAHGRRSACHDAGFHFLFPSFFFSPPRLKANPAFWLSASKVAGDCFAPKLSFSCSAHPFDVMPLAVCCAPNFLLSSPVFFTPRTVFVFVRCDVVPPPCDSSSVVVCCVVAFAPCFPPRLSGSWLLLGLPAFQLPAGSLPRLPVASLCACVLLLCVCPSSLAVRLVCACVRAASSKPRPRARLVCWCACSVAHGRHITVGIGCVVS